MSRNRLDQETSPYLLQHRHNPVHWRAWGTEALAEARDSGKPILLSVGYAACHWCHVMAHESFEDAATAALMNEHFIPIKVDREERPDVDVIYQSALGMLGQQGGWPLTMFLTPEAEPFWGGTYFPPQPRYGRPGFREVLTNLAEAYRAAPDKVTENVVALREALARNAQPEGGGMVTIELLDRAASSMRRAVDPINGGLVGAPKFPQPQLFNLIWRGYCRTGEEGLKAVVALTLEKMSRGGIYDHLGGGYSRYSTDEVWLAPHFEKMLYDNAQLIELLTALWQDDHAPFFAARIEETITWLLREMLAEHDAFAAALDADSEGVEGKFYVWTLAEIEELLPEPLLAPFVAAYDVTPGGNWEGKVILNRSHAQPTEIPDLDTKLAEARTILLAERAKRIRPERDDKILADWNGMMIAALAKAAFAFDRPDWLEAARKAFAAIATHLTRQGRLGHCYRHGRLQPQAVLDDHAQMARAGLTLFETTGEVPYLAQAESWVAVADAHHWDGKAYFFTADDTTDVIVRTRSAQDQATPSGNGVMVEVLARLYHLTGKDVYRARAEAVVQAFSGEVGGSFPSMAALLSGWELLAGAVQTVVVGAKDDPARQALLRTIATTSQPNLVLMLLEPGQALPEGHPAAGKTGGDQAKAYVCTGPVCTPPMTTPEALRAALNQR